MLPWTPGFAATVRYFVNRGLGEELPLFKVYAGRYNDAAKDSFDRMYVVADAERHATIWKQVLRFLRLFPADARLHGRAEPHPMTTEGPCEVVNGRRGCTELIKHYMLEDWQPRVDADTAFRASNLAFFTDMATPYTQEYAYTVFRAYAAQMGMQHYILAEVMLTAVFGAMYPMRLRKRLRSTSDEPGEERPFSFAREERPRKRRRAPRSDTDD